MAVRAVADETLLDWLEALREGVELVIAERWAYAPGYWRMTMGAGLESATDLQREATTAGRRMIATEAKHIAEWIKVELDPPKQRLPSRRDVASRTRAEWNRLRPLVEPFIRDRDGYCCQECGCLSEADNPLGTDHIVPVARLGSNAPSNLRTLCRRCNSTKGAR